MIEDSLFNKKGKIKTRLEIQREHYNRVLIYFDCVKLKTARHLDVSKKHFADFCKKHGLPDFKDESAIQVREIKDREHQEKIQEMREKQRKQRDEIERSYYSDESIDLTYPMPTNNERLSYRDNPRGK